MTRTTNQLRQQYAALPYRTDAAGHTEVLLVTSRDTGRWVVPKGNPISGLKPHEVAEREAFEEAGVTGRVGERLVGSYRYLKRSKRSFTLCQVEVFPLAVDNLEDKWPERDQRQRSWFDARKAGDLVEEKDLGSLIRSFGY